MKKRVIRFDLYQYFFPSEGELWSCGRDESGETGLRETFEHSNSKWKNLTVNVFTKVKMSRSIKWAKVSGGCYTSAAITSLMS